MWSRISRMSRSTWRQSRHGRSIVLVRHGKGYMKWISGRAYEGRWKNDEPQGRGQMEWPNGQVYRGQFEEGKMEGKGKIKYPNGEVFKGKFENNKAVPKP